MRKMLVLAMILTLVGSAMAFDLGNQRPAKPVVNVPVNVPSDTRQGGDTIIDAVVVAVPYSGAGTTVGFNDDYDETCPYSGSTSPDVVYTFTPAADMAVDIDLGGSAYDTKVFVYDGNLALVACNDDFYSDYTSKLENMPVGAGIQYFVVVDGYGGSSGDYVIAITEYEIPEPCVIECPAGAVLEGEPTLVDDYVDAFNGGCNSPDQGNPFGVIDSQVFCGVSGFYATVDGQSRDTDWFQVTVPEVGYVEVTADAEYGTYLFELGPQDCGTVAVIQNVIVGPCEEGTITIPGTAGSQIWLWVGPIDFDGAGEYDYVLHTNLVVATESHSWTGVKALFN